MNKVGAILLAAGSGERMGGQNKLLRNLMGKTLLERSLDALLGCDLIDSIVIASSSATEKSCRALLAEKALSGFCCSCLRGGSSRGESVYLALQAASLVDCEIIVIHDAARCLVSEPIIRRSIEEAREKGSAVAGVVSSDSLKYVERGTLTERSLPRQKVWRAQTPQTFRADRLREAYEIGKQKQFEATDDSELFEMAGYPVYMIEGSLQNIKITTREDLLMAEALLAGLDGASSVTRSGYGEDVHRLVLGRPLVLGGLKIPYERGLLGHSDADVLCHAISDALLGAMNWTDIGQCFPDSDEKYKGADSLLLLVKIVDKMRAYGQSIEWIDACLVAQEPKLGPYFSQMKQVMAAKTGIDAMRISLKATTSEGLGFTGRSEGIACRAVVTVRGPLPCPLPEGRWD